MSSNTKEYLAKTFQGLETVLADELRALGAEQIKVLKRAVSFKADKECFYKVNYLSRVAIRVLKPVLSFQAGSYDELYDELTSIDWREYFHYDRTFAISTVSKSNIFKHSQFTSLKAKDAIVDHFREKYRKRPFVETHQPDIRIHLHINHQKVRLYLDASGESLHKRGYRQESDFKAPLNECLAAGMLLLAGWDGSSDFVDPMCGSGTLLVEAGMIARNIPAQRYRSYFSFHQWPDFDLKLWKKVKQDAAKEERTFEYTIKGSDINPKAIRIAASNLRGAGLKGYTDLSVRDISDYPVQAPAGLLMVNPPYDDKIKSDDIFALYRKIGDAFKKSFPGWEAWVFSARMDALKHIGLKTSARIPLFNGPKPARLCKYTIQAGSYKK